MFQKSSARIAQFDRWTKGPESARDRLAIGVTIPVWKPSFTIASDAKIFAIGSCFARNLEKFLWQQGIQTTSTDPDHGQMEIRSNLQLGLLNKYNLASLHQELAWAAGIETFPEQGFLECQGKVIDPYLRQEVPNRDLEFAKGRRDVLRQYFARAFSADVVILTLGLTETWFDKTTKQALTEAPNPRWKKQYPDRFGFRILEYPDCVKLLQSIYAMLQQYGKPDVKIIVTVSPVALERTFSDRDVIIANMSSKSTLRSAAVDFANHMPGVDYFPSYEAAMLSDPLLVWQSDRRRVTDLIVIQIVSEFTRRYGLNPPLNDAEQQIWVKRALETRIATIQQYLTALHQGYQTQYSDFEPPTS